MDFIYGVPGSSACKRLFLRGRLILDKEVSMGEELEARLSI